MGSECDDIGSEPTLTNEQQEFLQLCEDEFADRFTEHDEEFRKVKALPESMPPIIDPWYSRSPRNFDWSRTNSRGRRYYEDRDRRDRDRDHDRNRGRDWQNHRDGGPVYNTHRYRDRRNFY